MEKEVGRLEREAKRPGRKAMPANQGARAAIGLKVTPTIKNRIDGAARENGRTQSQEAEARLEQSFLRQDLLASALELAYGPEIAAILLMMAREFAQNGRIGALISQDGSPEARRTWHLNAYAYGQAVKAANKVMKTFQPPGDPTLPAANEATARALENRAEERVAIMMAAVKNSRWGDQFPPEHKNRELERFAEQVRDLLGPDLVSRIPSTCTDFGDQK
jgi:hypothetical protein